MNAQNDQTPIDVLDVATAALRDAAPAGGPSPALVASTIEAMQALSARPKAVLRDEQKWFLPRLARYGSLAAAAALALVAGALWLMDRTAATTFAQMVENVRKAKSVSFVLKQKLGDQALLVTEMAIQGDRLRYVLADSLALIIDLKERKELQLDMHQKIADRIDLKGRVPVEMLRDPIERLRNLKDEINRNVEQLGDEELDGHNCHVFQVKGRPKKPVAWLVPDSFKLWVDAKTGLPVRILAEDERTSLTYERFLWDEPLREQLFSLEVPDGYRLRKLEAAVIKPDRIYFNRPSPQLDSMRPDGTEVR
ncbi:MAG TPA: hypothetical protein VG056_00140, partial [Pirellulales bacterium]|nr:hypothetical protein [Pirellulales bacterium]